MKRQMRWLGFGAIAVVTTLGSLALAEQGDEDHRGGGRRDFSNWSIKGHWGYNSSFGQLLPPTVPEPLPFVGMGRIYFDGRGGCEVSALGNLNGQTIPSTSSSCTYSVNPDGTGTSDAVFPGTPISGPIPVAFVIVDGGREIRFMNTKYIVGTFTARRQ
jgi:hypothetical protein